MTAGLGTRLQPFTQICAKPLLPLMGVPIVEFNLIAAVQAGAGRFVANVHHLPDDSTKSLLEMRDRQSVSLRVSDERSEILGGAGALREAKKYFDDSSCLMINGDILADVNLQGLAKRHHELRDSSGVLLTLWVRPGGAPPGKYRKIGFDPENSLVTELGSLELGAPFWAGTAIFEWDALKQVPHRGSADFVSTVLEPLIREKKVGVYLEQSRLWSDIGSPELWYKAHCDLIRNLDSSSEGSDRARLASSWVSAINKNLTQVGSQIWVNRNLDVPSIEAILRDSRARGPILLSECTVPTDKPLGPGLIAYSCAINTHVRQALGFRNLWFQPN